MALIVVPLYAEYDGPVFFDLLVWVLYFVVFVTEKTGDLTTIKLYTIHDVCLY